MATVVWVLDVAQVVVLVVVVAGNVAVVGGDVAVELWGSGLEKGGWEGGWGAVDGPGMQCRRSGATSGGFGAWEAAVVAVVGAVVKDDMALVTDGSGC